MNRNEKIKWLIENVLGLEWGNVDEQFEEHDQTCNEYWLDSNGEMFFEEDDYDFNPYESITDVFMLIEAVEYREDFQWVSLEKTRNDFWIFKIKLSDVVGQSCSNQDKMFSITECIFKACGGEE